jgi:hypothetical protein
MRHLSAASLLACVLALTAVIVWLGLSSLEAPEPVGRSAFPAEKAMATLKHLLKENRPHPAGTPENFVVRERIEKILQDAGYQPEIQLAFQCNPESRAPGCTWVENVIAVHKGSKPGKAILVTAHYDSVPAGPGASDDGVGTAVVLELARHMATRKTENDFIFLITDGEETGLRGAYAFAQRHELMKSVGLVINVEARGARGPSMMFETGTGNAALIDLFGQVIERPVANSFIYEIYRLLPNDTDFSVYRRAGIKGFNFAHSNAASLYHSQRDEIRYLDPNTLQHHGDNVFALATALENASLERLQSDADASYFDVFGRTLVSWPASINLPLSGLALLVLLGFAVKQRHEFGLGRTGLALVAFVATPLLMFATGWLLSYPLGVWPGTHPLDHPDPWAGRVATIAAAYGAAFLVAAIAARLSASVLFLVSWILFALMSIALSWYLPGAAFFVLWPVVITALLLWVVPMPVAALVGTAALAFFSLPYVSFVELVLGFANTQFKILVIAPLCISLVSCVLLLAPRRTWWPATAMFLVTAVSAFIAMQTPAYALSHPRGVNFLYYQDGTPPPDWIVATLGATDEHFMQAQGLPSEDTTFMLMDILPLPARVKPATDVKLAPPVFDQLKVARTGSRTTVLGVLIPARSGYQAGFGIPAGSGITSIRIGEPILDSLSDPEVSFELVGQERLAQGKPIPVVINGLGGRRLPVEIVYEGSKPPELYIYERTGLEAGPEADRLRASRPADAAPVHTGDASIVVQKVMLGKQLP